MNLPDVVFPHLKFSIDTLNAELPFAPFGLPLYWYGVFVTLGVLCGIMLALYNVKRLGGDPELYIDFAFIVVPACIIGARIYYVIFDWDLYKNNLIKVFAFREGGLAIYGAVIVAIVTAFIYAKRKKVSFLKFCDLGIVGLPIGQAIGRFGNFFNREAFGGYTDGLFAMRYKTADVDYSLIRNAADILDNLKENGQYIQVHPAFLYESVLNFAIVIFILLISKHKKFDGQILAFYLIFYGTGRFLIEGIRTDSLMLFGTGFAVSQVLSALLVFSMICFMVYQLFVAPRRINKIN